jgi:hypothetical protein
MIRHWAVSIDGGAPAHLDLAQYAAAIERAKQEGKPARVMIEANPKQTTINRVPQCVVALGHNHQWPPCIVEPSGVEGADRPSKPAELFPAPVLKPLMSPVSVPVISPLT